MVEENEVYVSFLGRSASFISNQVTNIGFDVIKIICAYQIASSFFPNKIPSLGEQLSAFESIIYFGELLLISTAADLIFNASVAREETRYGTFKLDLYNKTLEMCEKKLKGLAAIVNNSSNKT